MKAIAFASTKISSDKRGNPRVWIEGKKLERAGFAPQARYKLSVDAAARRLTLELDKNGDRLVSQRHRRGEDLPIIDIANIKMLAPLKQAQALRIDFSAGTIIIEPSAAEARRIDREQRTVTRLLQGEPLRAGSVSTGLGVLSHAIHAGLASQGIESELAFSVEIDQEYQDLCATRNSVWKADTVAINMPLQEFAFDRRAADQVEQIDILEAGIPCTAHSLAGRAKKGLALPEHDPVAGHLVVGFLAIVAACNPSVVIVENVPQYIESASFAILKNQLTEWHYDVDENILRGEDHGCLEHRHRMALIATSKGMSARVCVEAITGSQPVLKDYLEDVPDDSPLWSKMAYLKAKEERDVEDGKGFRMQILDPEATKVGTIGRGYAKVRSTEPKLRHPSDPELLRQFTPREHARIKGIPEEMVEGLPVTTAHEMLGQSIVAAPFAALGRAVGAELLLWSKGTPRNARPVMKPVFAARSAPKNPANDATGDQLRLFV